MSALSAAVHAGQGFNTLCVEQDEHGSVEVLTDISFYDNSFHILPPSPQIFFYLYSEILVIQILFIWFN